MICTAGTTTARGAPSTAAAGPGWTLACSIKPKSQMEISYPPNLVHILILLGFAKKIKFLAVPEVTANLTSCLVKNTKDLKNL